MSRISPAFRSSISVCVCFVAMAAIWRTEAQCQTVAIDPGAVGSSFAFKSIPFTELDGTTAAGQTVDLDFVFSDMKHVELDFFADPAPNFATFAAISLILNFNTTDLPPFLGPIDSYLSDELGNPVLGPSVPHTYRDIGLAGLVAPQPNHNDHEGLVFHDVHFSFDLANQPGLQVTGAQLEFTFFDPPQGDFIVGSWVPEPATIALAPLAFAALTAFRRWRR